MACPLCKKPTAPDFFPFCSERCKLLDLNNWFSGAYVIPTEEGGEAETPPRLLEEEAL